MSTTIPTDPHDLALWLFDNLEGPSRMAGGSIWEGRLPDHLDFNQVETHLGAITGALLGTTRAYTRTLEFYPSNAHVY